MYAENFWSNKILTHMTSVQLFHYWARHQTVRRDEKNAIYFSTLLSFTDWYLKHRVWNLFETLKYNESKKLWLINQL